MKYKHRYNYKTGIVLKRLAKTAFLGFALTLMVRLFTGVPLSMVLGSPIGYLTIITVLIAYGECLMLFDLLLDRYIPFHPRGSRSFVQMVCGLFCGILLFTIGYYFSQNHFSELILNSNSDQTVYGLIALLVLGLCSVFIMNVNIIFSNLMLMYNASQDRKSVV